MAIPPLSWEHPSAPSSKGCCTPCPCQHPQEQPGSITTAFLHLICLFIYIFLIHKILFTPSAFPKHRCCCSLGSSHCSFTPQGCCGGICGIFTGFLFSEIQSDPLCSMGKTFHWYSCSSSWCFQKQAGSSLVHSHHCGCHSCAASLGLGCSENFLCLFSHHFPISELYLSVKSPC